MDYEMTSPSSTPEMQGTPRPEYKKRRCSGNKVKDTNMVDDDSNDTAEVEDEAKCNGIRATRNLACAKDRWGKLKTTMTVANSITPKKKSTRLDRGDSFLRKFSTRNQAEVKEDTKSGDADFKATRKRKKWQRNYVIHPYGGLMFYWLGIVTIAVMYNLWTCIAREAFREIQHGYTALWFCLDGVSDFIYICDIFVHLRTGFLQQGLMVYDSTKLCKNYVKDKCFIVDLLCLLPLDLLQLYIGIHPMLRFPRFLKMYRCMRFMHTYESRTAYPNLLRVANLTHILFLGSHWFAAFYYLISEAEGFDGEWSYPKPENKYASVTRKYLASLYWSTLTLTTIGDLPPPDTNWQYVFVIVSYLIGVFIFATIVGQVGNVITNRNASRQEFERLLDGAKFYMQMHNIPPDLQRRVQRWYDYVWTRGRLNCNDINSLGLLPDKLKTELALHVNLGTLKKVTIFQKCRPEFLHDLMLKMRAYIFTPGDMICRRGEVAREMFIIADGVVEILGENATVLTQMSTGDFFGEIGILNLDGGINRRTADVRSVGYSELFVLSREDVLAALKDHPDAEQIIREFGQRRLKETEEHRKMVKSAPNSPDPSSAWKRDSRNGKGSKREPNRLVIPTVKYLQKLPQMSPKLKKMFRRKPTRSEASDKQKDSNDDKHDDVMTDSALSADTSDEEFDMKNAVRNKETEHQTRIPLEIIEEKDGGVENSGETDVEDNIGAKNFTLASVVLNLLKNKRKTEYTSVKTGESCTDDDLGKIKIGNIGDLVSGSSASVKGTENDSTTKTMHEKGMGPNELQEGVKSAQSNEQEASSVVLDSGNDSDCCKEKCSPVLLTPPKIVLTRDTNLSDSDSSESGEEFTNHPPTPHPARRSHLTRKSSPCILPTPSPFLDKFRRRVSLPPPLDLPIEVPRFSQFRGLTPNSDVTVLLQQFKRSLDSRLDDIESSYKETLEKVERNFGQQDKMMRGILRKLSDKTVKISAEEVLGEDEDEVSNERVNIPDESVHSRQSYEEQLQQEFLTVQSEPSDEVYCEHLRYKTSENTGEPETIKPETDGHVTKEDGNGETAITIDEYCNVDAENQNTAYGTENTHL